MPWYPYETDRDILLPLQRVLLPIFIYSLAHGEGLLCQALQFAPLHFLGKYVFGFYVLHNQLASNIAASVWLLQLPTIFAVAAAAWLTHEYYLVWVQLGIGFIERQVAALWRRACGEPQEGETPQACPYAVTTTPGGPVGGPGTATMEENELATPLMPKHFG